LILAQKIHVCEQEELLFRFFQQLLPAGQSCLSFGRDDLYTATVFSQQPGLGVVVEVMVQAAADVFLEFFAFK
jgi:hypothetical protein